MGQALASKGEAQCTLRLDLQPGGSAKLRGEASTLRCPEPDPTPTKRLEALARGSPPNRG
jgi:hypothetical protein